jgi:hypothetical protein
MGRVRTCAGEQEDIARAIPIGTRGEPVHAFFEADEIRAWMRPQVVAGGHQLLTVENLIGFRVPVSRNWLTVLIDLKINAHDH